MTFLPAATPAHDSEGFRHGSDFNIDFPMQVELIDNAAPALAEDTFTMRVVHHKQDIVGF